MEIEKLEKRAKEISDLFDKLNKRQGIAPWGSSDIMSGMVGDVGDMQKLVMAKAGRRKIDDVDAKFNHEWSDLLWSVLELGRMNGIDTSSVFMESMSALERKLIEKLEQS